MRGIVSCIVDIGIDCRDFILKRKGLRLIGIIVNMNRKEVFMQFFEDTIERQAVFSAGNTDN